MISLVGGQSKANLTLKIRFNYSLVSSQRAFEVGEFEEDPYKERRRGCLRDKYPNSINKCM